MKFNKNIFRSLAVFVRFFVVLGFVKTRCPDAPNVIFILVDALRADHLGCYGYNRNTTPAIDEFARDGVMFKNAISQSTWMLPSMASLFLSRYVSCLNIKNSEYAISDDETTLARVLKSHGYKTGAFTEGCYASKEYGFNNGFDYFYDSGRGIVSMNKKIYKWLLREKKNKFFLYIHYADAHYPYNNKNPYGTEYGSDYKGPVNGFTKKDDFLKLSGESLKAGRQHSIDLYDNEICFIDRHIKDLFVKIKKMGLQHNTVIFLTTDHGEAFLEHRNQIGHRGWVYEELIHVPLIIKGPSLPKGRTIPEQVECIDIMPTILDVCGIPIDNTLQGESLYPLIFQLDEKSKKYAYSELIFKGCDIKTIRTNTWKLIQNFATDEKELYNLINDPAEKINLIDSEYDVAKKLEKQLILWTKANKAISANSPQAAKAQPSDQTKARLRSLGYIN